MRIEPSRQTTRAEGDGSVWFPATLPDYLVELAHVRAHCAALNHCAIYRGHASARWRIDSTFARFVKRSILGIDPADPIRSDFRHSLEFHRLMSSLFLCKFGTLVNPSAELQCVSRQHGGDAWFELMKRIQQYPEEDLTNLKGTFLLDWTQDWRVALWFANRDCADGGHGVVHIADMTQAGSVLHQDITVGEILERLREASRKDSPVGCPLMFFPRNQIACRRANNQQAIYVAQMDLRVDLGEHWSIQDNCRSDGNRVLLSLVLPKGARNDVAAWLLREGVTQQVIYPDDRGPLTTGGR